MKQEENEILRLLVQDLDHQFHHLVTLYQHRLYAVALRHMGNEHDAQDLVQEVFMQAYYALRRYPAQRIQSLYIQSWLYRILLNLFYNNRNRLALVPMIPLDLSEDGPHLAITNNEQEQPDQVVENREAIRELERFVHLLPERYRTAINLYYFEDYSQQEIADLLHRPLGTVKSIIHRGTTLLRHELRAKKLGTR